MLGSPTCAQCARGYIRSAQTVRLRPYFAARANNILRRHYAQVSTQEQNQEQQAPQDLSVPTTARYNEIGVQHLSSHVYPQIFPGRMTSPSRELVALSKAHLARHDLLGKNQDDAPPVGFDLPPIAGRTMDEHFQRLGLAGSEPYLSYAKSFVRSAQPQRPRNWERKSGWTKVSQRWKLGTGQFSRRRNDLIRRGGYVERDKFRCDGLRHEPDITGTLGFPPGYWEKQTIPSS